MLAGLPVEDAHCRNQRPTQERASLLPPGEGEPLEYQGVNTSLLLTSGDATGCFGAVFCDRLRPAFSPISANRRVYEDD